MAFCLVLIFLDPHFSIGQEDTAKPAEETVFDLSADEYDSIEPLQIKLSVNEIRIDVVVLDRRGNPVTDLTAEDFEILQDNKRQNILSSVYIDTQPDATTQSAATRKDVLTLQTHAMPALKKEDVHRTILFVVDDYQMTFENGNHAKMALRNFVEKQMQPGDLVSILRTDYGNSALNMFQSDKREVLARINALPPAMFRRFARQAMMISRNRAGVMWAREQVNRNYENQLATLAYSIRMMKNMPGRKILNLVTTIPNQSGAYEPYMMGNIFGEFAPKFAKLADEALRAGVVVNILYINGLEVPLEISYRNSEAEFAARLVGISNEAITLNNMKNVELVNLLEPNDMPEQTGGISIVNSNFFLDGIGRDVESLMKGYYLISYEPPADTFKARNKSDDLYRRLKVNVNRRDVKVHTRKGFFGILESEPDAAAQKQDPLIEAVYSPFQSTGLNINIAAGYVRDAEAGYLVRSWIHVDSKDVKIAETEDGGARIDLETICVTSDINGNIRDSKRGQFTLTIKPENKAENLAWIEKHGIRFNMLLPVKKSGPYYVQVSILDKEAGKVGSAYQFLEIPDVGRREPALSNTFILTGVDDLGWMLSDAGKTISEGVFFPVYQEVELRSPALRTYMPGDGLQTLTVLYNADLRAISRSEIKTHSVLYRDGKEIHRGEQAPITSAGVDAQKNIPILQRLAITPNMQPGQYVLQLEITDKNNKVVASQTTSFTVTEK